jgi:serine/threonine protein kinase
VCVTKPQSEEVALRYFRETCVGLSFLHANGVAHRDLKPDNLLKKTDGTVKITDFGVSELFDGSKKGNLTGGVGTPAFVAPELVATREAAAAAAAYFEKDLKPILKPSRSGSKPGFETDVAARELAAEAEEDSADCDGKGGGVDAKACDVWSLGVCLFYQGAFYTLVPIRPRRRGGRRSLRTFAVVSLRPPRAFNARPRRLSAPPDAFELHPDNRLYGTAPSLRRRAVPGRVRGGGGATRPRRLDAGACIASFNCVSSRSFVPFSPVHRVQPSLASPFN